MPNTEIILLSMIGLCTLCSVFAILLMLKNRLVLQHSLFELKEYLLENSQKAMQTTAVSVRDEVHHHLKMHGEVIDKRIKELTERTDQQLNVINHNVEKRLNQGFEKTTATFTDVVKRLALIDQAQHKITELSNSVVSLQEILADKKSRGTFGEVQLEALVRNVLPEAHFNLQHTLANGKRADCMILLPRPTGNIVIDAKFPLESYRNLNRIDEKTAQQQFRIDIKKHINDIASKYICPPETADGAILFLPAEAIFADIHSFYPDIVEYAYTQRVWLTSPTTMMAILTTMRAVLKDSETQKQVHIIQEHIQMLSKDFERFDKRMQNLAKHIDKAQQDVSDVNVSAKKLTNRFSKIENVDLKKPEIPEHA